MLGDWERTAAASAIRLKPWALFLQPPPQLQTEHRLPVLSPMSVALEVASSLPAGKCVRAHAPLSRSDVLAVFTGFRVNWPVPYYPRFAKTRKRCFLIGSLRAMAHLMTSKALRASAIPGRLHCEARPKPAARVVAPLSARRALGGGVPAFSSAPQPTPRRLLPLWLLQLAQGHKCTLWVAGAPLRPRGRVCMSARASTSGPAGR